MIALDKPTIRECLEDYFARSEQLQTHLVIRTGEFEGKAVAGGMLLQIMPDGTGSRDDFEHLATLTETVKDEELFGLEAEELLYRLYHEEQVEVYPPQDTEFKCGCSRERSGSALLLVPAEEIEEMLEEKQGVIDMQCECCGTQYFFDKAAIEGFKEETEKLSKLGLN
ncbi:33 kDa chaperonin [Mannheimia haemolytica]